MSFPRYPRYRDSGVEWLGEIPEHWEVVPVKRCLLSITQGWSPQCESYPADSEQWGVLKVGCVNGGAFDPSENKALPDALQPIPALSIRKGDVLVSRANTRELVGSVAVAERDYDRLLLCDKLYRLRVDARYCDAAFLARSLSTSAARGVIEAVASGASSSMLNIAQTAITGMCIALPPVMEQHVALAFLDRETAKIDTLVEEQKRLIELLKEKRQAVISQAVTKGLNPSVPRKDSAVEWLGEVPAHWTVTTFHRCVKVAEGQVNPEDPRYLQMPLIAPNHVESRTGRLLELESADQQGAESGKYLCEAGDVVYSKIRPALRKACIAPERCLCSADMYPLRAHSGLTGTFLLWVVLSEHFSALAVLESQRVAMPKINRESLKAVALARPPLEEQAAISTFLAAETTRLDLLKTEAESAIRLLQERRSALISAAVTGKIDVRALGPRPHGEELPSAHDESHDLQCE